MILSIAAYLLFFVAGALGAGCLLIAWWAGSEKRNAKRAAKKAWRIDR